MNFNEYAQKVTDTKVYDESVSIIYPLTGLASEAGEALDELKKAMRDGLPLIIPEQRRSNIFYELGDVIWYWVNACKDLGFDPELVMESNIEKLAKRYNK